MRQNDECLHGLLVKQLLRRAINTADSCQKASILWSSLEIWPSDSYLRHFDAYLRLKRRESSTFREKFVNLDFGRRYASIKRRTYIPIKLKSLASLCVKSGEVMVILTGVFLNST